MTGCETTFIKLRWITVRTSLINVIQNRVCNRDYKHNYKRNRISNVIYKKYRTVPINEYSKIRSKVIYINIVQCRSTRPMLFICYVAITASNRWLHWKLAPRDRAFVIKTSVICIRTLQCRHLIICGMSDREVIILHCYI